MIVVRNITNKYLVWTFSFTVILIVFILDLMTGIEIATSIFYLIPIAFTALYKNITRPFLIVLCLFAAVGWYVADVFGGHEYSSAYIPYWNSFVRFSTFVTISMLLYSLKEKNRLVTEINAQLQELNEEKNRFIGIAAHDLRNPITAIMGFSEMLLDRTVHFTEEQKTDIFKTIESASNHLLYITENILNISNIESGKLELRREYQDYCDVVKHCVYINSLLASKKNISIDFEPPAESVHLFFDKQYIAEVLDNVISNAIKYSYVGSRVTVRVLPNASTVRTEVIDVGVGIHEHEIPKLFQPFQKTSSIPTSGEKSTGLGLAIVKKVITLHGGTVGVTSARSVGSTFYFDLPVGR